MYSIKPEPPKKGSKSGVTKGSLQVPHVYNIKLIRLKLKVELFAAEGE